MPHGSRRSAVTNVKVTERRRVPSEMLIALPDTLGIETTTAVQTVLDCSLDLPLLEAVVVCDSALRARAVSMTELRQAAGCLSGVRNAVKVHRVLDLCDPECGSVLESVLRVRMSLAGMTGFDTQQVIRDGAGGHVLRVDFVFARERLVVEVDGDKWHQDGHRDRRLDNAVTALGWRVLRYRWSEVVHTPELVLAEIQLARTSAVIDDCQQPESRVVPAA